MKIKPSYWYKQSAVIPYRRNEGEIELLIITNRKNSKWIFPKGIVELDLSSKDSAVKEAIEEAGVHGIVEQKLGKYSYKKWGSKCKVKVFGLRVENVFDEWDENLRERKWIKINEVDKYIGDNKILEMVKDLEDCIYENE